MGFYDTPTQWRKLWWGGGGVSRPLNVRQIANLSQKKKNLMKELSYFVSHLF